MYRIAVLCLLTSLTVSAFAAPNLATNPGFESVGAGGLPEGWGGPANVYSRVTSPVHSGGAALQWVNPNAGNYALCRQELPLKPGKAYEFSVWAKCENIVGNDSGATICLEWYTADDGYLGGAYPAGIKGTHDWTLVKGLSGRVPDKTAKCYVVCYVRKGMTGKAWFDDVTVSQWAEPPLQTMLTRPNYRGLITAATKTVEVVAQLKLEDYDLQPEQVRVRAEIVKPAGGAALQAVEIVPTAAEARLTLPTTGLARGDYRLRVTLQRKDGGAPLGESSWRLQVPSDDVTKRAAYIDEHNRLIVNGKPFLPLGMYFSGLKEDELKQYADSDFNCLMPYGGANREQMDLLQRLGLKIIYTLKDVYYGSTYCPQEVKSQADEQPFMAAKARQYGNHPALLAWYLNDELSVDYMPRLEAHQEWMETLDPNHPTWIVLYQVGQLDYYRKTFDVLGTDPYPIPMAPARRAADYTSASVRSVMGSRPVWQVPQVMNWACYRKTAEEKQGLRAPTFAEMRSMTWQCLTEGATGLVYYSWFDLKKEPAVFDQRWAECKQMAAEVKRWSDVLLSIEPTPAVTTRPQEWLHWTVRRQGDAVYLFVVNDEDQPHEATFKLPGRPRAVTEADGTAPLVLRGVSMLPVSLEPFGVRVLQLAL